MFGGIPFGFEGMGGMPGMGGGGRRGRGGGEQKKDDDPEHVKLYEVLGVAKAATASQIKKAYFKKARTMHPDKGGDPEKFKVLQSAYDILKDEEKRELYNKHGKKAAEDGQAPQDMSSMFGGMFGGGGGRPQGMKKGDPVVHNLKLSLEQLYSGVTRRMRMTRQVIVSKETGELCSNMKAACKKCSSCGGAGVKMVTRRIGPGMLQQMQQRCQDCGTHGWSLKSGWVQKQRAEELKVQVEKGTKNNHKIKLSEMGDMVPGQFPGDVVFCVKQKEHDTFKRKGKDLLLEKTISLREALCGFLIKVNHLDGRVVQIGPSPGMVISPGQVKCVVDEGMPIFGEPFSNGRLFIHFTLKFPKDGSLSEDQVVALNAVLGGPESELPKSPTGKKKRKAGFKVDSEAVKKHRAQLDKWRDTKIKQWNKEGHKLRKKFPQRAALDTWMEQQCAKAMKEYEDKNGGGAEEDEEDEDDDFIRALVDVDLKEFGVSDDAGHGRGALDSDDEDERRGGARQVQCAQQ